MTADVLILVITSICTAIFASVTAPLILAHRTEKMHREDQLEQYKREDRVAAAAKKAAEDLVVSQRKIADQAAEAATLLLKSQQDSIARTNEVARLAAAAQVEAAAKLDQLGLQTKRIHTLVNSEMTAARQAELDQTRAMIVVLKRVIALAESRGLRVASEDAEALESAQDRAAELEAILADRLVQVREVEAEQKIHPIVE